MKFSAFVFLVVPCLTSFIEEKSEVLTSWGAAEAQPIQEWVSRRQSGRAHLRELSREDVRKEEEASMYLPHPSHGLKMSAYRKMLDEAQAKPLEGRMAPRTQKADRPYSKPKGEAVSDVNVAAKRVAKQEKLADKLSHWRKMQKERATATTTAAPLVHVKHVTKSHTPLTDRYRNRRLANQQPDNLKGPKANVTGVMVKEAQVPMQAEPVEQTKQQTAEEAKVTKVTVTDVKVKELHQPVQAEQPKQVKMQKIEEVEKVKKTEHLDKAEKVEKAKVTNVKVTDVKVKEVQPPMPSEQATMPKQDKVEEAEVTKVKVANVKVKEAEPPTQAKEASLPKQEELEKAQMTESKALDIKVKEAQPQSKLETETTDAHVVSAHVAATKRSVLSCVCAGEFGQGDRIQYVGHAFPPGRTTGTVLTGTNNGFLNIEWDNFHEGHTGNCQLSSCGSCESSAVASRWFTACSDVKMMDEAPKMEAPKMEAATTTAAPRVHVKHVTKSQTPLTDRYRNRRLANQQPDVKMMDEAPKMEAPKTEAPKMEAPKTAAPKMEAPKTEAPKMEALKMEAPKTEAPKMEAPKMKLADLVFGAQ